MKKKTSILPIPAPESPYDSSMGMKGAFLKDRVGDGELLPLFPARKE
jgi:hypothetical protein